MDPHYKTFSELFHGEISYASELNYPPTIQMNDGIECVIFYKLTLRSDGTGTYKTWSFTFDTNDWDKVKILVGILTQIEKEV